MTVNSESVAAFRTILENPKQHGFDFKPLADCFNPCEVATPKHILFDEYRKYIDKPLPKIFFYIIMDSIYPMAKAPTGEFGYKIKLQVS